MIRRILCGLLICAPLSLFAQGSHSNTPPRLVAADLPRYPPIAEAAHITGWLKIQVTVEKGRVIGTKVLGAETKARGQDSVSTIGAPWLVSPTLENLKSWRFSSDVNGAFVVKFTYSFAGTETDQPTNPTVEVLPSLDVNVIARPVKPVVEY